MRNIVLWMGQALPCLTPQTVLTAGSNIISCRVGCRYMLLGPPDNYIGPQLTATVSYFPLFCSLLFQCVPTPSQDTKSKAIKAGPTDYWVDLERYSLNDCKQVTLGIRESSM